MKITVLYILFLPFGLVSCNSKGDAEASHGSGENYEFWVSIEKAQERAYDQGKYIVLDIYTEWCGFCRRMNKDTYGDERVQDALERYYYPVRINAESDQKITFFGETYSMSEFALKFGATSYPTTVFISSTGELIAVQPGFIDAHEFFKMLSYVGTESYHDKSYKEYSVSYE